VIRQRFVSDARSSARPVRRFQVRQFSGSRLEADREAHRRHFQICRGAATNSLAIAERAFIRRCRFASEAKKGADSIFRNRRNRRVLSRMRGVHHLHAHRIAFLTKVRGCGMQISKLSRKAAWPVIRVPGHIRCPLPLPRLLRRSSQRSKAVQRIETSDERRVVYGRVLRIVVVVVVVVEHLTRFESRKGAV